jgi:hypothetical protein
MTRSIEIGRREIALTCCAVATVALARRVHLLKIRIAVVGTGIASATYLSRPFRSEVIIRALKENDEATLRRWIWWEPRLIGFRPHDLQDAARCVWNESHSSDRQKCECFVAALWRLSGREGMPEEVRDKVDRLGSLIEGGEAYKAWPELAPYSPEETDAVGIDHATQWIRQNDPTDPRWHTFARWLCHQQETTSEVVGEIVDLCRHPEALLEEGFHSSQLLNHLVQRDWDHFQLGRLVCQVRHDVSQQPHPVFLSRLQNQLPLRHSPELEDLVASYVAYLPNAQHHLGQLAQVSCRFREATLIWRIVESPQVVAPIAPIWMLERIGEEILAHTLIRGDGRVSLDEFEQLREQPYEEIASLLSNYFARTGRFLELPPMEPELGWQVARHCLLRDHEPKAFYRQVDDRMNIRLLAMNSRPVAPYIGSEEFGQRFLEQGERLAESVELTDQRLLGPDGLLPRRM